MEETKLKDGEYQIYVIENDYGRVKIGITTNFKKRKQSLSGSNGGGGKITREYLSIPTSLYTLERVMHIHYADHRIDGTEWFDGVDFDDAVAYLKSIVETNEFCRLDQLRRDYNDHKGFSFLAGTGVAEEDDYECFC